MKFKKDKLFTEDMDKTQRYFQNGSSLILVILLSIS